MPNPTAPSPCNARKGLKPVHSQTNDQQAQGTAGAECEENTAPSQDGAAAARPGEPAGGDRGAEIEVSGAADDIEAADWRAGLADEKVRTFAERFTSPAEAAKAAFELRQKLSNTVELPGKNASIEDIVQFHRKLGVPESPDQYEVALPNGQKLDNVANERINNFLAAMHGAGAPPAVVQTVFDAYFAIADEATENQEKRIEEARGTAEAELRREWGADYEANVQHARRAANDFGGERFTHFLENAAIDGIRLGDHPEFTRAFAAAGRRMSEDGIHMGLPDHQKTTIQDEIDSLQKQKMAALNKGESDKASRLDARQAALYERLHGSATVVGSGMRTI